MKIPPLENGVNSRPSRIARVSRAAVIERYYLIVVFPGAVRRTTIRSGEGFAFVFCVGSWYRSNAMFCFMSIGKFTHTEA